MTTATIAENKTRRRTEDAMPHPAPAVPAGPTYTPAGWVVPQPLAFAHIPPAWDFEGTLVLGFRSDTPQGAGAAAARKAREAAAQRTEELARVRDLVLKDLDLRDLVNLRRELAKAPQEVEVARAKVAAAEAAAHLADPDPAAGPAAASAAGEALALARQELGRALQRQADLREDEEKRSKRLEELCRQHAGDVVGATERALRLELDAGVARVAAMASAELAKIEAVRLRMRGGQGQAQAAANLVTSFLNEVEAEAAAG
jgi:hypothetical protein